MKKYFITSDTHSFYTELKTALDEKGFDINNPDHIFVLAGDLLDRGFETKELYEFIISIPKERRILIRGNHEYLLRDALKETFPGSHDFSNGTVRTCCNFIGADERLLDIFHFYSETIDPIEYWDGIRRNKKLNELVDWMFGDEWVDYYELGNLILTHAFIPVTDKNEAPIYRSTGHDWEYKQDWRNSTKEEFEEATWGCPWQLYREGLFDEEAKNGKTLVCGHWHSSDFYENLDNNHDKEIEKTCPIYYGKNIIAIDACTAYTKRCNVLVANENGELL